MCWFSELFTSSVAINHWVDLLVILVADVLAATFFYWMFEDRISRRWRKQKALDRIFGILCDLEDWVSSQQKRVAQGLDFTGDIDDRETKFDELPRDRGLWRFDGAEKIKRQVMQISDEVDDLKRARRDVSKINALLDKITDLKIEI